jgi:glycosyltransferase involved in cell wall biosynthesis
VNDCSQDGSLNIIRSNADPRISLVSNEVNCGQTRSLNRGLKLAKGEYIARIDADDLAFPRWLEDQVHFMENHPEYAVVSTTAAVIDENGKARKVLRSPLSFDDVLLRSLVASPLNHVGSLIQKEKILKLGGYSEDLKIAADYEIWSKLLRAGEKIVTTPGILTAIRVHGQSVSRVEHRREVEEVSKIIYENILSFTTLQINQADAALLTMFFYYPSSLSRADFLKAEQILTDTYSHIKPRWLQDPDGIKNKLKKQILHIYMKRILGSSYFEAAEIRDLSLCYMKKFGYFNQLLFVYFIGFLGRPALGCLPGAYNRISAAITHFKMALGQ